MRNNREEQIIVSLTSIKSREAALQETISTLVRQDIEAPYEVRIHISREPYLLDEGFLEVPAWIERYRNSNSRCRLKVVYVENTGPFRKLLPVLAESFREGSDPLIVTCDDDTRYSENWLSSLLFHHRRVGGIVAYRGHTIRLGSETNELLPYSEWQKNPKKEHFSLLNIPTGKDGVVYRRSYFGAAVLNIAAAKIISPTADDLWFRWHSILRGVPCYLVDLNDKVFSSASSFDEKTSLWEIYNKKGANDQAVAALETYFTERFGENVASVLSKYERYRAHPYSRCSTPNLVGAALLAARQVEIISMVQQHGGSDLSLFARSYELLRRCQRETTFDAQDVEPLVPREDRGGLLYAKTAVDQFNRVYGWMMRKEVEKTEPLVSVIMTTFNSEATVCWAAESILEQDYRNIELIIVDDVSVDETRKLLGKLKTKDPRVRLFFLKKNRGTYFAKNVGIRHARGEYIAFQDSDDWSHPSRLRVQLWRLRRTGKLGTRCNYVRHHARSNHLVRVNGRVESPGFITFFTRRDLFDKVGYFDCARRAADDELICRVEALYGENAIDTFPLPAYVALYTERSLIADSSSYRVAEGVRFELSHERESYKKAYLSYHEHLKVDRRLVQKYSFPPTSIFIYKTEEMSAFKESEIPSLMAEVQIEEQSESPS